MPGRTEIAHWRSQRVGSTAASSTRQSPRLPRSPLAAVSAPVAGLLMTSLGIVVMLVGVLLETRGRSIGDRALVLVATLSFAPVVYELLLGQVTLLIAATLYPIAHKPDAWRSGVLFGIALAIAPKPFLLPVLLDAHLATESTRCLCRSSGRGHSTGRAGGGTRAVRPLGWPADRRRARIRRWHLRAVPEREPVPLWPLDSFKVLAAVLIAAGALWTIVRGPSRGFVAALLAGLLLAPYTGLYSLSILLLAVTPALLTAPLVTPILALLANPMLALAGLFVPPGVAGIVAVLPIGGTTRSSPPIPVTAGTAAP